MITLDQDPSYLYYIGTLFTVEWYVAESGAMAAKAHYASMPPEDQNRLDHMVKFLTDSPIGTRLPKNLYNLEDAENKIYAFKLRDHRGCLSETFAANGQKRPERTQ